MDEQEKTEEQVEDLAVDEKSAEDVKGGTTPITADDDWESPVASRRASPKLNPRGGWDGNHNETLIAL
jgi:hypothetical protein